MYDRAEQYRRECRREAMLIGVSMIVFGLVSAVIGAMWFGCII